MYSEELRRETRGWVPWRIWTAVLGLLCVAGATWLLARVGPTQLPLRCFFHSLTGLHCPGCGMTRASYALLHGDILTALRNNPVGVMLFPCAVAFATPDFIRWLKGERARSSGIIRPWVGKTLVVCVIGFWILRNLPWEPFSWLAPL